MFSYCSILEISPLIPYLTFQAYYDSLCLVIIVKEDDFAKEFNASPLYPIDLDL